MGVAALIVILSVMNGFEGELRERLLSMTAHGFVTGDTGLVDDWHDVRQSMLEDDGVIAAAPLVEMEGMIRSGRSLRGVLVQGVIPDAEATISGATDRTASTVVERPVHYQDVLATLYHNLGIDARRTTITDPTGRPQYLLDRGVPIRELV